MLKRYYFIAFLATVGFSPLFSANGQFSTEKSPPRLDEYGDPLPENALLRIGTVRLRTGGKATHLRFTADGKRLVTISCDTGGQVWDVATGKLLLDFGQSALPTGTISPDGSLAALVGTGQLCRIYLTSAGKLLHTLENFCANSIMCFSPDSKMLAFMCPPTDNQPASICVTDFTTGKTLQRYQVDSTPNAKQEKSNYRPLVFSAVGGNSALKMTFDGRFLASEEMKIDEGLNPQSPSLVARRGQDANEKAAQVMNQALATIRMLAINDRDAVAFRTELMEEGVFF